MEALSSALICTLVIDPAEGEPSFHEQLVSYERVVDQIRFKRQPLRPARVIFLCRNSGHDNDPVPPPPHGHLSWTARLEEYEMCCDENLWKFGPVNVENGRDIHSTFATIASRRILRSHESQGDDSDGSQQSDPPPCYDAEMDSDYMPEIAEEVPEWMTHLHVQSDSEDEHDAFTPQVLRGPLGSPLGVNSARYSGENRFQWLSPMQKGAA
jgi:hypothetical protein